MSTSAHDLLLAQARHHHDLVERMSADLSAEQASHTLHARGPGAAWLLAHLCQETDTTRRAIAGGACTLAAVVLCVLEEEPDVPLDPATWAELREAWEQTSREFLDRLQHAGPETLEAPPQIAVLPAFESQLRSGLDFLRGHLFHLAWHLGQLGSLRGALGLGFPRSPG